LRQLHSTDTTLFISTINSFTWSIKNLIYILYWKKYCGYYSESMFNYGSITYAAYALCSGICMQYTMVTQTLINKKRISSLYCNTFVIMFFIKSQIIPIKFWDNEDQFTHIIHTLNQFPYIQKNIINIKQKLILYNNNLSTYIISRRSNSFTK